MGSGKGSRREEKGAWGHGADEEMGTKEDREAAKGSLGERGKVE